MILAVLALAGQAVATPALPADWSALPMLRWKVPPRYDPEMTRFVVDEVRAGRCAAAQHDAAGSRLTTELAILVAAGGRVRTVTPRAIGCPTVEQYASGLISSVTRDNLAPGAAGGDGWYRTSITFAWQ